MLKSHGFDAMFVDVVCAMLKSGRASHSQSRMTTSPIYETVPARYVPVKVHIGCKSGAPESKAMRGFLEKQCSRSGVNVLHDMMRKQ